MCFFIKNHDFFSQISRANRINESVYLMSSDDEFHSEILANFVNERLAKVHAQSTNRVRTGSDCILFRLLSL